MAITITEKAAREVKRLIAQKASDQQLYLRVGVSGGGCSGFQHKLDLDTNIDPEADDLFDAHGVAVAVDKRSGLFLDGATVDFIDDLNRGGFRISNPNARSTCGCGSSFSV